MTAIGGYLELELNEGLHKYHDTPYQTKSGRASLSLILEHIKPALVYLPFYTCDTLLEPFRRLNISYTFYNINEYAEPDSLPKLGRDEYYLYINYFDLKRDIVHQISEKYRDRLIVDCTQAFFMKGNGLSWFFNSCRKFFGVPDGSYLYAPGNIELAMPKSWNEDYETAHLLKRFNGHLQDGYEYFRKNEELAGRGVSLMSRLTDYLLSNINYVQVAAKRRENYSFLHSQFGGINLMDLTLNDDCVPMSYPLLTESDASKSVLFPENIFIPSFWADTLKRDTKGFDFEKKMSQKLWPLPVDQRYSAADMELLASSVKSIFS